MDTNTLETLAYLQRLENAIDRTLNRMVRTGSYHYMARHYRLITAWERAAYGINLDALSERDAA